MSTSISSLNLIIQTNASPYSFTDPAQPNTAAVTQIAQTSLSSSSISNGAQNPNSQIKKEIRNVCKSPYANSAAIKNALTSAVCLENPMKYVSKLIKLPNFQNLKENEIDQITKDARSLGANKAAREIDIAYYDADSEAVLPTGLHFQPNARKNNLVSQPTQSPDSNPQKYPYLDPKNPDLLHVQPGVHFQLPPVKPITLS